MINNVVNRMSSWAHYLSQDQGDEDAQRLTTDVVKLLEVVRAANELLLRVEEVTDRTGADEYRDVRVPLIDALKAVAEHRVEIIRP